MADKEPLVGRQPRLASWGRARQLWLYDTQKRMTFKQMLEELRSGERFDIRKGGKNGPDYKRETYAKLIAWCEANGIHLLSVEQMEEILLGHWATEDDGTHKGE